MQLFSTLASNTLCSKPCHFYFTSPSEEMSHRGGRSWKCPVGSHLPGLTSSLRWTGQHFITLLSQQPQQAEQGEGLLHMGLSRQMHARGTTAGGSRKHLSSQPGPAREISLVYKKTSHWSYKPLRISPFLDSLEQIVKEGLKPIARSPVQGLLTLSYHM